MPDDSATLFIAGQVFAGQLAARTDVAEISDSHLAQFAEASVRAARVLIAAARQAETATEATSETAAGGATGPAI